MKIKIEKEKKKLTIEGVQQKIKAHKDKLDKLETFIDSGESLFEIDEVIEGILKAQISKENQIIFLYESLLMAFENRAFEDQDLNNFIKNSDKSSLEKYDTIIQGMYKSN